MSSSPGEVPSLITELEGARLGDERLNRRLGKLATSLADRAGASFPKALDEAELEAAYRFFGNKRVTPDLVLAPHVEQTVRRARERSQILVVHDTTEFEFGGQAAREGLGRLVRPGQGFFGHFSLALSADGMREPLGLLNVETIFRHDKAKGGKKGVKKSQVPNRGESIRWQNGVTASAAKLDGVSSIHVMDREADSYAIFSVLIEKKQSFVIRSFHDRTLVDESNKLRKVAASAPVSFTREVPLTRRAKIPGPKGKRNPPRNGRNADLAFAATAITLARPREMKDGCESVSLNVIHVSEPNPPQGEPPVEWFLLTNLPIDSDDAIAFVIDSYRARWVIEEFFKALKTGCRYEQRQLESASALLNALAVLAPVAWRMLLLRHHARHNPETPATAVLTSTQLSVLRATSKKPLPEALSAMDALLAVARLGGHLKSNGEPGWQILGRGMHDLMLLELGWRAAARHPTYDQS